LVVENTIFSRERLAGYEPERMGASTVLVVGAGALGQNTAMNLALAGVGEIRIVDRDRFEEHNRTRSPAYPLPEEQDIYGLDKAGAVARKLRRLMTAPRPVMRYASSWIQEIGDGAFAGVSAVVSCVDSQLARAYLSDKTRLHHLPFIEGGFAAENLILTSFPAASDEEQQSAPCWRCLHPEVRGSFSCRNYARLAEAAGIIPAIQNSAAVLGGLQAEAAIMLLHDGQMRDRGPSALSLNIRTWDTETINLTRNTKCPGVHISFAPPIRLTVDVNQTVRTLLEELGERLGEPARVRFSIRTYAKLLGNLPCTKCRQMVAAQCPEWRWMMTPYCIDCGSTFPVVPREQASSVENYPELTLESNPALLDSTCQSIGLMPLSWVEAVPASSLTPFYDDDPLATFFELPGSVEKLFESGDR
jgi:molybdopterin/thiamine biosynthesis adenylyltransferase